MGAVVAGGWDAQHGKMKGSQEQGGNNWFMGPAFCGSNGGEISWAIAVGKLKEDTWNHQIKQELSFCNRQTSLGARLSGSGYGLFDLEQIASSFLLPVFPSTYWNCLVRSSLCFHPAPTICGFMIPWIRAKGETAFFGGFLFKLHRDPISILKNRTSISQISIHLKKIQIS